MLASRGGGGGGLLVPLHILLYVMFDKYDGLLIVGIYVLLIQQKMIQLAWTMCMKISIRKFSKTIYAANIEH